MRWGKTTCPKTRRTSLVYKGRVGGSLYSLPGGSAEYLCMPETGTEYLDIVPGYSGNQARQVIS